MECHRQKEVSSEHPVHGREANSIFDVGAKGRRGEKGGGGPKSRGALSRDGMTGGGCAVV